MFMQRLTALTALVGLSFFSASSIAAPIAVPNGDFNGLGDTNNLDNWTPGALGTGSAQPGLGGGGFIDNQNFQQNLQSFSSSDANGDNGDASLEQVLSATFTEGLQYTLTGNVGARGFTFQDFTAEATVTLELFDSVTGEIVATDSFFPVSNPTGGLFWNNLSAVGTAEADNAGNAIGIRIKSEITNLPSGAGQVEIRVDNIALDAVPEPGSLALLGLGGLLIARRRRG